MYITVRLAFHYVDQYLMHVIRENKFNQIIEFLNCAF